MDNIENDHTSASPCTNQEEDPHNGNLSSNVNGSGEEKQPNAAYQDLLELVIYCLNQLQEDSAQNSDPKPVLAKNDTLIDINNLIFVTLLIIAYIINQNTFANGKDDVQQEKIGSALDEKDLLILLLLLTNDNAKHLTEACLSHVYQKWQSSVRILKPTPDPHLFFLQVRGFQKLRQELCECIKNMPCRKINSHPIHRCIAQLKPPSLYKRSR